MDTLKSLKSEIKETLEEIYRGLDPEAKRKIDKSCSLSEFERETGVISTHRIYSKSGAGSESQSSERLSASGLYQKRVSTYPTNPPLSWEAAVERFKIPRMHQSAKMAQFPSEMAQDARSWIGRLNYSLYISGSSGSGKTQFCVALLKELISLKKFSWIIFIRSDELDDELLSSVKEGHESYVLEKYHTVPILFLDDLGVERLNERIIKQYYSIIDRRLNNFLPTVFSSNILRKDIAKNLGERIASRLHLADEMIFPDKDYRKE